MICNHNYIITYNSRRNTIMCDRIAWTLRIKPDLKRDIAIEAAQNQESIAITMERIIKEHLNAGGQKHE